MKHFIYVTGCLGFIGSHITELLLEDGHYVRGVDSQTYAANMNMLDRFMANPNFSYENKDINDLDRIAECDYFINTAAESHVDNSIVRSNEFLRSNVAGVHHILELLRNHTGNTRPHFIHFSTDEVYGDIMSGSHTESDILKPSNPYSATKAAADQLILAWGRTYKIPYTIVRPTNNYGPRQYSEKLIPKACKLLNAGKKIPLHDDGKPVRTWLHVKDTANAIKHIIAYLDLMDKGERLSEIFNISGGEEIDNRSLITEIIKAHKNIDSDINIDEYCEKSFRTGQDMRYSLDDFKLRITTGWCPQAHILDEVKCLVEHFNESIMW